ncbi:hypothetical protein MTR_2g040620 [Medicago truncatula]|uniref:Uncharacterized protein n=1 Tax=Medicago truncatula TaxID=3880 RepID=A0A072V6Q9_MEDTR|nr:hypothetical protein MTR_2g040620 [Medicago truncatula]
MAMGVGDSERVSKETNGVDVSENMNPMTIDELDVEDDYVIQHDELFLNLIDWINITSFVATAVTKIEPIGSTGLTGITKKLFQSPSHISRIPVTNPYMQPRCSLFGRGKTRVNEVRPFIPRVINLIIPRGIKWRFKPTPEMQLSPLEVQVCAYVFHPDQDAEYCSYFNEPLMSTHNMTATRADIECLCPEKPIKDVVTVNVAEEL